METAIYATIYLTNLNSLEEALKTILAVENFKRIEKGTVLLYEDAQTELSIEPHSDSLYLSGRVKNNLLSSQRLINGIANVLKDAGIHFSLDYQEENEIGIITTPEFNISNKIG